MTEEAEQKPADGKEENAPEAEAGSPDAAPAGGPGDASEPAGEDAESEPAGEDAESDYQAVAADLNDKLLRAVAELANYRRWAEK